MLRVCASIPLGAPSSFGVRRPARASVVAVRASSAVPVPAKVRAIEGKTVVVTGSNRGIGKEWVKQLLGKQNTVIACTRDPSTNAFDEFGTYKEEGALKVAKLDVSDLESIKAWARELKQEHGHIDYVINNAGIYGERQAFEDVTPENMMATFQTNTLGPFFVTQQLMAAGLIGGSSPSVVGNVTSKVGSVADNGSGGGYAYRSSKSALNIINKSMSIDLEEYGITSCLLHPGWVRTDMTEGRGLIDTDQCVSGLIDVLESELPLNGCWYDYKFEEVPW